MKFEKKKKKTEGITKKNWDLNYGGSPYVIILNNLKWKKRKLNILPNYIKSNSLAHFKYGNQKIFIK